MRRSPPPDSPAILRVGQGDAVIAWHTPDVMRGEVHYRPAGIKNQPVVASQKLARCYRHEVLLTGLQPGRRLQFQTQPNAMACLVMEETPDVILDVAGEPLPRPFFWIVAAGWTAIPDAARLRDNQAGLTNDRQNEP